MIRLFTLSLALMLGAMLVSGSSASAQSIVAVANGTPVTSLEVQQRRAFLRRTGQKVPGNRAILDQIIDEALIMGEAQRRRVRVTDEEVDARFAEVARSANLSASQLAQAMAQAGSNQRTFKNTIRSQIAYQRLVSGRFNPLSAVSERDVAAKLQESGTATTAVRYTLREIVVTLPRNASQGVVAQRRREAENLRGRFKNCDEGAAFARGVRNIAVRDPVVRTSTQLPDAIAERLASLRVGQVSAPHQGEQGLLMYAICDRQEVRDDSAARAEIQNQLAGEVFSGEAERYLKDLRERAIISYR